MRILIITPSLPYPPHWGFGIRVFHLVKNLNERHEVSLLTIAAENQQAEIESMNRYCRQVYVVSGKKRGRRLNEQFHSLFGPRSFLQSSLYSDHLQNKLNEILANERFDVVQIESSHLGCLRIAPGPKVVLDEHNIEYMLLKRMYQMEKSPTRRLFSWAEFIKLRREELELWDRADGVIFTSELEREQFSLARPKKPVHCAPNGVDVEFFKADQTIPDPNLIVMTGLMRYRPNIDGALFFVNEILPRVRERRPNSVIKIVGSGPPNEVLQLAGPDVMVTGYVPDVRPYLNAASVVVVPLRMGSGTRLKVLEALSMSKAVVTTSLGCEGLDVKNGESVAIADQPDEFAEAVLRLMDDRAYNDKLGIMGRNVVERLYSWKNIVNELNLFYEANV